MCNKKTLSSIAALILIVQNESRCVLGVQHPVVEVYVGARVGAVLTRLSLL